MHPGQALGLPAGRAAAFSRLFDAVHEGVYVGLLGPDDSVTIAANPYFRIMLGYPAEALALAKG